MAVKGVINIQEKKIDLNRESNPELLALAQTVNREMLICSVIIKSKNIN